MIVHEHLNQQPSSQAIFIGEFHVTYFDFPLVYNAETMAERIVCSQVFPLPFLISTGLHHERCSGNNCLNHFGPIVYEHLNQQQTSQAIFIGAFHAIYFDFPVFYNRA